MKKAFIENEYAIKLGSCYCIKDCVLRNEWLNLLLIYHEAITLIKPNQNFNQRLIKINAFPIKDLYKKNFTGKHPTDDFETLLSILDYCLKNDYNFIPDLE